LPVPTLGECKGRGLMRSGADPVLRTGAEMQALPRGIFLRDEPPFPRRDLSKKPFGSTLIAAANTNELRVEIAAPRGCGGLKAQTA